MRLSPIPIDADTGGVQGAGVLQVLGGDAAGAGELVFLVRDGLVGTGDLAADQIGLAAHLDVEAAAEVRCYGFNSWLRSVYLS